jgi:hypothetical protein
VAEPRRQLAGLQHGRREVATCLRGGRRRGPVQGVSPDVEAGAGEERAPEAVEADPPSPEDVPEVVGVDVVAAEVVEHLRELHEGEVVRRRRGAVEVEAHGLQGGGAGVAGHVAVQHQHVGRVAHKARHPKLTTTTTSS